jgi:hypothetical protein
VQRSWIARPYKLNDLLVKLRGRHGRSLAQAEIKEIERKLTRFISRLSQGRRSPRLHVQAAGGGTQV